MAASLLANKADIVTEPKNYTMADMLMDAGAKEENAAPFANIILPYAPRTDQVEALRKQVLLKRFGLFSEARCGKSISFTTAAIYFAHHGIKSLILMPPALFLQYQELWYSIENNPASFKVFNLTAASRSASLSAWRQAPPTAPDVLVMTKEIFKKHLKELLYIGYKNLVYDEAHLGLQSRRSHMYEAVLEFVNYSGTHRLTLSTGTPLPNELLTAYPTISLINPGAYFGVGHFERTHVNYGLIQMGHRQFKKVVGYNNIPLLHQNLYLNAHRATKAEVLKLKTPNVQVVPVELSKAHQRLYRRLLTERVLEVRGEVVNAVQAQALRQTALQMISNPDAYSEAPIENRVLDTVETLIETLGVGAGAGAQSMDGKVVVFANYNRTVRALAERLKVYNPAMVYGPGTDNAKQAERFKKDQTCRVLVANPVSGGVGLTLGGVSSVAIFAEPTSSPGAFDQAASRIMLDGQTEPVSVYILKVLHTLSPRQIELMLRKAGEVKEANQDKKSLLDELLGEANDN